MTGTMSLSPFTEVAPRVYRATAEPDGVTIGLIVGEDGALVVDCGSTPSQGQAIRAAARAVAGIPVTHAVVTHWHRDHFFGLAAFADLVTIGHASLADRLGTAELAAEAARLGVPLADLLLPSLSVEDNCPIDLGNRRIDVAYFGPGHSEGDVVVFVPDVEVVFTGDLLEESGDPNVGPDSDLPGWLKVLDQLIDAVSAQVLLIPGHGQPVGRDFAIRQRADIADVNAP